MRTKLKAGWIQYNIGKTNRLFRKYKTFYYKITNINKIFYHHRICGIPMHPETEKICIDKIKNYLIQMDSLWHAMIYDEIAPEIYVRHSISSFFPLGYCEQYVYINFYRETKAEIAEDRRIFQERKEYYNRINNVINTGQY
jgi:hypothetical protein